MNAPELVAWGVAHGLITPPPAEPSSARALLQKYHESRERYERKRRLERMKIVAPKFTPTQLKAFGAN